MRRVIRWAHGQGACVLTALEVPGGDPGRLPVTAALPRALARAADDALDAAVGRFVQAHAADPLAGSTGEVPVLQLTADGGRQDCARRPRRRRAPAACAGRLPHRPWRDTRPGGIAPQAHETLHFTPAVDLVTDISGVIVTADALHTVAAHARYLHRRGAFSLFPAKENRPTLFTQLDALDGNAHTNDAITVHRTEEANSGRYEPLPCACSPSPKARSAFTPVPVGPLGERESDRRARRQQCVVPLRSRRHTDLRAQRPNATSGSAGRHRDHVFSPARRTRKGSGGLTCNFTPPMLPEPPITGNAGQ